VQQEEIDLGILIWVICFGFVLEGDRCTTDGREAHADLEGGPGCSRSNPWAPPMDVPTVIILGFGILEGSGSSTNDPLLTNDLAHDFDTW